jgi:adenylate kinase
LLAKKIKLPVISTGDLLRQEIKAETRVGLSIQKRLADGKLASDSIVKKLLGQRIEMGDIVSGAIFDGYPRRASQQKFLIHELDLLSHHHDKVWAVLIDVSDKEVMRRLGGRRVCYCGQSYHLDFNPPKEPGRCDICGKKLYRRPEDNPASIKIRLDLYHEQNKKLLGYWHRVGRLLAIDGSQGIAEVQKDLVSVLKKHKLI